DSRSGCASPVAPRLGAQPAFFPPDRARVGQENLRSGEIDAGSALGHRWQVALTTAVATRVCLPIAARLRRYSGRAEAMRSVTTTSNDALGAWAYERQARFAPRRQHR